MKKPRFLMSTENKIEALGFKVVEQGHFGIKYERRVKVSDTYSYTQVVEIRHSSKKNDYALLSYDPDLFDQFIIGNTNVGLLGHEVELFSKKIKELNRNWDSWITV